MVCPRSHRPHHGQPSRRGQRCITRTSKGSQHYTPVRSIQHGHYHTRYACHAMSDARRTTRANVWTPPLTAMPKTATGGPSWSGYGGVKAGWLGSDNPCTYAGVTCDSTGRVVELSRAYKGLVGTIPTEFGFVTKLTSGTSGNSFFMGNSLTGTLPSELGQLTGMASNL